jgi:hypothetical protein
MTDDKVSLRATALSGSDVGADRVVLKRCIKIADIAAQIRGFSRCARLVGKGVRVATEQKVGFRRRAGL